MRLAYLQYLGNIVTVASPGTYNFCKLKKQAYKYNWVLATLPAV